MVFKGYLKWNPKNRIWEEDEWLTDIYRTLREAKEAIEKFADGHPFDNDRELRVTRYYGKSRQIFDKGKELAFGDPGIVLHEWMRYAEYPING